jgi:YD repeat-containing protein
MGKTAVHLVPYYHTSVEGVVRPYCLNYFNSTGELASTRLTYDRKGKNTMGFYQQISGGRSSKNLHEFDKQGRLTRKFRQYNDGETSEELFQYDESGRLILESFESSKAANGSAAYEYDEAGNACRMNCYGYKGWLHGYLFFDFDEKGKRLSGRISVDDKPAGTISYEYDRQGNLTEETWKIGDWSQTFRYVYEAV